MKSDTILISSLPPSRCGVATYAAEHLLALRASGADVTTCSPLSDSQADHVFSASTISGAYHWYRYCRNSNFHTVHLHYVDKHYFPWNRSRWRRPIIRVLQSEALRQLAIKAQKSSVVFHELPSRGDFSITYRWVRSRAFAAFGHALFHTRTMRDNCMETYEGLKEQHTELIDHAQFMRPKFAGTKVDARVRLGLPLGKNIFLCLGFLQPIKGFQDAAEAFGHAAPAPEAELHIVGSIQSETKDLKEFIQQLVSQCESIPGVFLHEQFISDEEFDCWLAAADSVILPYRGVASSGVGARASLYKKPLIIRNIPNLVDQFPQATVFTSVEDLSKKLTDLH